MSLVSIAVDYGSARSPVSSAKIVAPAPSRARRAQPFFEGLGGASSLPLLAGVIMGRSSLLAGDL